jgi:hypothetical protein
MEARRPGGLTARKTRIRAADRTSRPGATGHIDTSDVRAARRHGIQPNRLKPILIVLAPEKTIRCLHVCR